jgi:hypothetical protein
MNLGLKSVRSAAPTGLASISHFTRHFRAGLSHTAATRLRLGGEAAAFQNVRRQPFYFFGAKNFSEFRSGRPRDGL